MKVNSINNTLYNTKTQRPSFKHTAVPYPEYEKAYAAKNNSENIFSVLISKVSDLFKPEVTKEAKEIKAQIDKLYGSTPQDKLLSVLA